MAHYNIKIRICTSKMYNTVQKELKLLIALLIWLSFYIVILSLTIDAFGQDYNQTLCALEFQCYICGPLDENVCILGDKR